MEMILLIGIPAAGKSKFYAMRYRNTHARLSLEAVQSRKREKALFDAYLTSKQSLVIDNINATASDRARYIKPAKEADFRVKGFFFEPDTDGSLLRNSKRKGKYRVPAAAIYTAFKRLEPPGLDEGFDELYRVNINPSGAFIVRPW